jgi:carboxyl-terminal processing protease
VAACLQDHHRAAVAGQRSYGKGTVQQLIPMQNGKSLLKLTWASFWRPSGAKIHRSSNDAEESTWGVVPDTGLEHRLSQQEHEAYLKHRSERDGVVLPVEKPDEKSDDSAKAEFTDEQLNIAVKHLQSALLGESQ